MLTGHQNPAGRGEKYEKHYVLLDDLNDLDHEVERSEASETRVALIANET